ncbi:hypothetical protein ACEWY4_015498 [Coilia grayii]|uniref:Ig-like domain-containing protein n=1 Tax=Coilia grayii TaxID=363190 RepID=A0ABD1JP39_9TELE
MKTKSSDEAIYFCGFERAYNIEFKNGTLLKFQEISRLVEVVQTSLPGQIYPGDSVALQCTVLAEIRTEDLRIFWISTALGGELQPGLIYPHNNSSKKCEDSSQKSCTHELRMSGVRLHDAGMHYCAVSACGQIALGNGTMVTIG